MSLETTSNWPAIIKAAARSPLGLASLAVLVLGLVLFNASTRLPSADSLFLSVAGCLVLLSITMGAMVLHTLRRGAEGVSSSNATAPLATYDIFLSTPMASLPSEEKYDEQRVAMLQIIKILREVKKLKVYYGGEHIDDRPSFENQDQAFSKTWSNLATSRSLVLFYPRKLPSSCLIELGMALALRKPCIIFAVSKKELPFLLQGPSPSILRVYEFDEKLFENAKRTILENDQFIEHLTAPPSLSPTR